MLSGNDWNYDGDHTTNYLVGIVNARLHNFWQINSNAFYNFSSYDDQLTRGGPIAKLAYRGNAQISVNSDDRGAFSLGVNGSLNWNGASGFGKTVGVTASYQPASNVRLRFKPSFSRFHDVSQFVTGVNDPTATTTFGGAPYSPRWSSASWP